VLGVLFLSFAIQFSRSLTAERARRLFIASIVYLPLLLALLVIDKVK
jgi:heme O synthase-like polyprenyltransferase